MSRKELKVISVCTSDTSGGAARAAYRILKSVRQSSVDCRMFVKNKHTKDDDVVALDSFVPYNHLYMAFDWLRNKCKNKIQHWRWNRYPEQENDYMSDLRGTDLHGALKKLDYDVLHLHWINQRFVSIEDLPQDKPIIWTLHDSWPFCGVCHYFFDCVGYQKQCGECPSLHSSINNDLSHVIWKKKKAVYKNLDLHIVCPSKWLADCARKSSLFGQFPVTVIPNCLDVDVFRPLDEEKKKEKPVVLYGAFNATTDRRKGFVDLISALHILEEQGHKDDFELVVFGANGSDMSMNINIPVNYVGYVKETEELVSLYDKASVMVVPSLTENLSCTIMESLSCGTPVVAFNVGGNGDLIEHQKNGYLARYKDNEDLAAGILWCVENNRSGQLGQAARKSVLNKYTYRVVGEQYKALYESLSKH